MVFGPEMVCLHWRLYITRAHNVEWVYSEKNHTALGRTLLPRTLTSLLKSSVSDSSIPATGHEAAVFELLRIGANLAMDHGRPLNTMSQDLRTETLCLV